MKRLANMSLLLLALAGCASVPQTGAPTPGQRADPWEAWNRTMFAFNDSVDDVVVRPVAEGYRTIIPALIRTGIGNALDNIGDVWATANHFLQGKVQSGLEMGMRVLTNTLFGLGGVLDPATEMHLIRRKEDFGQTLGRWGVGNGPYLVLPLLGPSTVRDTAGFLLDRRFAVERLLNGDVERYTLIGLELINTRTQLLATTGLLDQIALDRYSFVRDAYLARRRDQLYDGNPPPEDFQDEPADAPATK